MLAKARLGPCLQGGRMDVDGGRTKVDEIGMCYGNWHASSIELGAFCNTELGKGSEEVFGTPAESEEAFYCLQGL